jgi:ABC-type lipoprotein release transport system permease subunit
MKRWELGGGQYWHKAYDPFDPFTLEDSHAKLPGKLEKLVRDGTATPVLITQGTIYPSGRMLNILIKGIDPQQKVIELPSSKLDTASSAIPAIMGTGMAASARLKKGDIISLRWRDKNGAFDAAEIEIVEMFRTPVPTVDGGQIWIPLEQLRKMTLLPDEATILVVSHPPASDQPEGEWVFKDLNYLLTDIENILKAKTTGGLVLWGILLMLAMLAVFDTQVLSIFRRQKEIGTYVAMGMTRSQVVALFTVEGAMHSVLAAAVGAVYGIPFLFIQAVKGLSFPVKSEDYGISVPETFYPVYSLKLIVATILIVFIMTTIVSYWPSRRIARMNPTDALRGKVQ